MTEVKDDWATRVLAAIEQREAAVNRAREWMGPKFQILETTERGAEVKAEQCWVQIAGERIWDADVELRRCAADRRIVQQYVKAVADWDLYRERRDNRPGDEWAQATFARAGDEAVLLQRVVLALADGYGLEIEP